MNGHGVFTWTSGNVYEGGFIDDERSGFGVMQWRDGTRYEGMWERGIQ